ncbi:hypothetical protein [Pseudoduganella rhizocola]|uniref:hypothetical protein n=1 Tax=Pseudoduganella rhizocola TaxID=3382643 RepID=UPI0038B683D0
MKAVIVLLAMLCCSETWARRCELRFSGELTVLARHGGISVLADAGQAEEDPAADLSLRTPAPGDAPLMAAGRGLPVWGAVQLQKGRAALRLTALPGQAALLDFSGSAGACRIYIGPRAMRDEEIALIPQHFPGADIVLPGRAGRRMLGVVTPAGSLRLTVPVPGEIYRFKPVRR